MRHCRAAALLALPFAAVAVQAHAQGSRKDDVVINSAGQPVGGATIRVCTAAATGQPCSPLANIYSDLALTQATANPLTADGLGNYYFYAAPGRYTIEISGTSLTDTQYPNVLLPNDPTTVPVKPQVSDSVQYVSPNGNDSNDGLSIGTAKLTVMAGYDALPSSGGTIYISGSGSSMVSCTSTPGQGIWIMGSGDPNYASRPAGWRTAKVGAVYFIGISAAAAPGASTTSWVTPVNCGSSSIPGVWLSGASGVTISRLRMVSESVRVSIDSNGGRSNSSNPAASLEFDHDDFRSDCATCGPTMDMAGNLIWVNVHDSTFENNAQAYSVSAGSNQASNIYISNGGASTSLGLLYFNQNFFTGGGGLRFDANTGVTGSVYAAHTLMEGAGNCQPVFEIVNQGSFAATFDLQGGNSDCGTNSPFVRVATGNNPCETSVRGVNQNGQVPALQGPLTVGDAVCAPNNPSGGVAVSDGGMPGAGVIPAAQFQRGMEYGLSQYADPYRRSFEPIFTRFTNLAPQSPSSWTANTGTGQTGSSLTQIQGPGDPSGATNAATLSCTGNGGQGGCDYYVLDQNFTFSAGDYLYIGTWVQPASTAGFNNGSGIFSSPITLEQVSNASGLRIVGGGPTTSEGISAGGIFVNPYRQTDGNWQWVWALAKVTAPSGVAAEIKIHLAFGAGYPLNLYAPMFVRIPASSVALVSAPAFSSASESSNTVTFTTSGAHKLSIGMPIVISACSVSGYNGESVVTGAPTSTTFTLYNTTTGMGAPTGCVITPGNDSEVTDWANNTPSYGDNCAAGTYCGIRGKSLSLEPQSSDAIQYVSPNGNDSNDGRSTGTAKLTLAGAKAALPSNSGAIHVSGAISFGSSLTVAAVSILCEPGSSIAYSANASLTLNSSRIDGDCTLLGPGVGTSTTPPLIVTGTGSYVGKVTFHGFGSTSGNGELLISSGNGHEIASNYGYGNADLDIFVNNATASSTIQDVRIHDNYAGEIVAHTTASGSNIVGLTVANNQLHADQQGKVENCEEVGAFGGNAPIGVKSNDNWCYLTANGADGGYSFAEDNGVTETGDQFYSNGFTYTVAAFEHALDTGESVTGLYADVGGSGPGVICDRCTSASFSNLVIKGLSGTFGFHFIVASATSPSDNDVSLTSSTFIYNSGGTGSSAIWDQCNQSGATCENHLIASNHVFGPGSGVSGSIGANLEDDAGTLGSSLSVFQNSFSNLSVGENFNGVTTISGPAITMLNTFNSVTTPFGGSSYTNVQRFEPGQLLNTLGMPVNSSIGTKSSAYTLSCSDGWINVTGTTTITVPHAGCLTQPNNATVRWVVFNSGSGTVTVQADSGNINGAASITLSANTGKEISCDGTNCFAH